MATPSAKPNRRGVARREAILDAAVEVFARSGYRAAGLLGLADRLGMTHPGILYHFGTKENLLRAVMARRDAGIAVIADDFRRRGFAAFTQMGNDEPEVYTRLAVVLRTESLDAGDPLHEYFLEHDRKSMAVLADQIRAAQARGEISASFDPEMKAAQIVTFSVGLQTLRMLHGDGLPDGMFRAFIRDLLAGPREEEPERPAATVRASKKKPARGTGSTAR
jgi:AcrR family transcriptional regulator